MIKLHDYQEFAKRFVMQHPFCALFLDMGLGKTLITLIALMEINPCHHCLIIAPKGVAISTWQDEIKKFKLPLRIHSLIVDDNGKKITSQKRNEILDTIAQLPPAIWVINRDIINDLVEEMLRRKIWVFGTVVIDESQSFKNPSSKRFLALAKVRPYIQRMILLSGTPAPNGLEDLWSQIWLLDQGVRLGKSFDEYRKMYFEPAITKKRKVLAYKLCYGSEDLIYNKISDICISMKNTMLTLPPITLNNFYVHMDRKEMQLYRQMMEKYVLNIDENTVRAKTPAVLSAKLSQMASGSLYLNENHEYAIIHKKKLEAVEYIANNTDSPILVAYHFQSDCEMLYQHLKKAKINVKIFDGTSYMKQNWNDKKIKVLLLQPASFGAGLNLQEGGHTLIWFTIPWSLEQYLQTNTRLYRQGQKHPVVVHHLLTADTIDDKILESIQNKNLSETALLDAVNVTINKAHRIDKK